MQIERVVPGVYLIRLGIANAYAIESPSGEITLVDAGTHRLGGGLQKAMTDRFAPGTVKRIVLTHHHLDHSGGVERMTSGGAAVVLAHERDAPLVRDTHKRTWKQNIMPTILLWGVPGPVEVRAVRGGDVLDETSGLRVIDTPGHTAGHISLLLPRDDGKNVLFTGDAAIELWGRVLPPLKLTTKDPRLGYRSYRSLSAQEFDVACFGHGTPLVGDAKARMFSGERQTS